jgi:hypothetical protein
LTCCIGSYQEGCGSQPLPGTLTSGASLSFPRRDYAHSLPATFSLPHGAPHCWGHKVEGLGTRRQQLWLLQGPHGWGGLPWQHHRPCPRGHWVPGRGPAKGGSPTLPLLLFLPFPCLPNIDLVPPVSQAQYLVMNTGHRPLLTGSLDRVGERQISKMTSERMSAVNKTKTMKCLSEVVLLGCKGLRHN